jgi:hypothetical protein
MITLSRSSGSRGPVPRNLRSGQGRDEYGDAIPPLERKNRVFGIDLAVSIMDGPNLSEKRRKELALALLMAETIGVILYTSESDSDIRIEAAKDMLREFRVVYPEIAEI